MPESTTKEYFQGLAEAKVSERNDYLEPDQSYVLKIKRTFVKSTRQKGDAFIAELEVVATTSTSSKMAVGKTVSWYQGMTNVDVAFGSIKLFCYAATGVDKANEEEVKVANKTIQKTMQDAVTKNTLAGTLIGCETSSRKTQPTPGFPQGKDFTNHSWSAAPKS